MTKKEAEAFDLMRKALEVLHDDHKCDCGPAFTCIECEAQEALDLANAVRPRKATTRRKP